MEKERESTNMPNLADSGRLFRSYGTSGMRGLRKCGAQDEHREQRHPPQPSPGDPRRDFVSGKRWDGGTLAAENHDMPQTGWSEHQRVGRTNREVGRVAKRQCHTITTDQHGVDATTAYGNGLRAVLRRHPTTIRGPFKLTTGCCDFRSLHAMQSCQELLSSNRP